MKRSIYIIAITSIVLQSIFSLGLSKLVSTYPIVGQDSPDFYNLSQNILKHDFFSLDNKTPEVFRTPGYPFFLALSGGDSMSLIFSILITAISAILVYLIGLKILPERYAFVAGLIYAASPSVLFHGVVFLSDGLFTFLLLLTIYLYKRNYFFTGLLLGIATLVRPIGVYLPLLFIWPFEKKKIWIIIGFIVIIGPWMIRNHGFSISSISTYNMAYYNIPSFNKSEKYFANLLELEKTHNFRLFEEQYLLKDMIKTELKGHMFSYALFHFSFIPKFLISSPIRYISINTGNVYNDFIGINKGVFTILNFDRLYMVVLSGLAFCSIFFRDRKTFIFIALIAYFAVLTGPVAIPRYRLPVDGFIIILALYTICKRPSLS